MLRILLLHIPILSLSEEARREGKKGEFDLDEPVWLYHLRYGIHLHIVEE
jgi:hypothetical protein